MADVPESDSPYDFAEKPKSQPPEKPARQQPPERPEAREPEYERTCPHCGFHMTTKPVRGRCPECAAALDDVAADLLQFANHGWLTSMANGCLILAAAVALQVVAIVIAWAKDAALGDIVHVIAAIIGAGGIWMLTAPEPGAAGSRTPVSPFARASAVIVAVVWAATFFLARGDNAEGRTRLIVMIDLLAMAAMAVAVGLHMRFLARRIPNDSLTSQSVNLGFILAFTCLLLASMHAIGIANVSYLKWFFCAFPMIFGMAAVVGWGILNLIRLALDLRHCAAAGQAIIARQAQKAAADKTKNRRP